MHTRKVPAFCVLLVLTLFAVTGTKGQSLADLAKKEKERRAQITARIRVLSNADVARFQNGAVTTGVLGEIPVSELQDSQTPGPAGLSEDDWRSRFLELDGKVTALENRAVLAQLELNDLRNRFFREDDGFFRQTIQKQIVDKQAEIEQVGRDLQAAKKALEDFKAEARRNRVPPGWIR